MDNSFSCNLGDSSNTCTKIATDAKIPMTIVAAAPASIAAVTIVAPINPRKKMGAGPLRLASGTANTNARTSDTTA